MHKQGIFILLFLPALFLLSCGRPSWVLSEKQMENVLFDIHIADAEISNNYTDFRTDRQKQDLYASIFKKHNITREQFDTSLVWYGKNLSHYLEIYNNLDKRYTILSDSITARIDRENRPDIESDSLINLWKMPNTLMLTSRIEKNIISFNIDTFKLSSKEYYELKFDVLGVTDSISSPLVTLGIEFPDSVFIRRQKITDNGLFSISVPPADSITEDPTFLFGSVYLPIQKENKRILIYNIGLYKKESK